MSGDATHRASAGPRRCAEAARGLLAARGVAFDSATVELALGDTDAAAAPWRVNDGVASAVRQAAAAAGSRWTCSCG